MSNQPSTRSQSLTLTEGWQLKQRSLDDDLEADFASSEGWLPATVPGVAHMDLLRLGLIPDPFYGENERLVQWVGETNWLYRCSFDLPAGWLAAGTAAALAFDGLDTYATVWLNGVQILASDNMFLPQRVDVTRRLKLTGNELRILFEAPLAKGKALEAQYGKMKGWNTDLARVYIRKAGYHFGWDWGPVLVTSGPWRAVRLEASPARIAEIDCPVEVSEDLKTARIAVRAAVEATANLPDLQVQLHLADPDGKEIASVTEQVQGEEAAYTFTVDSPRLWWPNGYGEQPLYTLTASLMADGAPLGEETKRLGLRRLRLVQEPVEGEPGSSFYFEVNNTPIFCGGANWIPADNLLPRLTPGRYRGWLQMAKDANMQMLRVWGGGIYEEDIFYDLCDELGLLVWQDFMFACGLYPAYPEFRESVRLEAQANIRRLRHHACLALWCGNNEDYPLAMGLGYYDPSFQGDFTQTSFPAREIYERLLPQAVAELDPGCPYWPGSPYNGPTPGMDAVVGDGHLWNVWHGMLLPYQDYPNLHSRFVSEFGMQGFPHRQTFERFAPPEEHFPQSRTVEFHNKAGQGPIRLNRYVYENLISPVTLDDAIYATQLVQAEALRYAADNWRRRWGSPGKRVTGGLLVWQINDCWPVISWSLADDELRRKPSLYVMKRSLAPLALGLARQSKDGSQVGVEAWAVNGLAGTVDAVYEYETWSFAGEKLSSTQVQIRLAPNQVTGLPAQPPLAEGIIGAARLRVGGEVATRVSLWPEPFKYYSTPPVEIRMEKAGDTYTLSTPRPVKGVWLEAGGHAVWSDDLLDLFPGDPQTVRIISGGTQEPRVITGAYRIL